MLDFLEQPKSHAKTHIRQKQKQQKQQQQQNSSLGH